MHGNTARKFEADGEQSLPAPQTRIVQCLVLDDNGFDRRLIRAAAKNCKTRLNFLETSTIAETRALLKTQRPDICLFDYYLPDGDGIAYMRELAEEAELAGIPVVVISQSDAEAIATEAMNSGAAGYLTKRRMTAETLDKAITAAFARVAAPEPEEVPGAAPEPVEEAPRQVARAPEPQAQAAGIEAEGAEGPPDPSREDTLARLGKLKGDVLKLLSQSWQLIDKGAAASESARARLSQMTRTAIATIDDLTVDAATGGKDPEAEDLALTAILRECVQPLDETLRKHEARVTATALPVAQGVKAHFKLLFEQLLLHALRFSRLGMRPVIEFGGGRAPDGSWTIWYRDSGVNLATRIQSDRRAFEQEGESSPLPAGFGLSICQRIVERNGGRLSIFGEKDGGCRIVMRFAVPGQGGPLTPRAGDPEPAVDG